MYKKKEPPKLGCVLATTPFVRGVADPLDIRLTPLHQLCYLAEFGRSRSNGTSVINEIRLKMTPRILPFIITQGHGTDTDRFATYDFLIKFHSI